MLSGGDLTGGEEQYYDEDNYEDSDDE